MTAAGNVVERGREGEEGRLLVGGDRRCCHDRGRICVGRVIVHGGMRSIVGHASRCRLSR